MSELKNQIKIKLLMVGSSGSGKTQILNKFCQKQFNVIEAPTKGPSPQSRILQKGDQLIKLTIWEIGDVDNFKVQNQYIKGSQGCFIVSSINEEKSLDESVQFKQNIDAQSTTFNGKKIPTFLINNKSDMIPENQNSLKLQNEKKIAKFSKINGFQKSFITSAYKNINIDKIFEQMLDILVENGVISNQITQINQKQGKFNKIHPDCIPSYQRDKQKSTKKGCFC